MKFSSGTKIYKTGQTPFAPNNQRLVAAVLARIRASFRSERGKARLRFLGLYGIIVFAIAGLFLAPLDPCSLLMRIAIVFVGFGYVSNFAARVAARLYQLPEAQVRTRLITGLNLGSWPKIQVRSGRIHDAPVAHPLTTIGGPCSVAADATSMVVLEKWCKFARARGPGSTLLSSFERIYQAFDLRPRHAKRTVRAISKDGIHVEAEIAMEFRVLSGKQVLGKSKPPLGRLIMRAIFEWLTVVVFVIEWCGRRLARARNRSWTRRWTRTFRKRGYLLWRDPPRERKDPATFNADEVMARRAVYAPAVDRLQTGEGELGNWADIPIEILSTELRTAISDTTFDRLYEPERADSTSLLDSQKTAHAKLQQRVREKAATKLKEIVGCELMSFSLGHIRLDPKLDQVDAILRPRIEKQLEQTWSVEWKRQTHALNARSVAETQRVRELVRAESQARFVRQIMAGLPKGVTPEQMRKIIALRAIEAMEQVQYDDNLPQFSPAQVALAQEMLTRFVV